MVVRKRSVLAAVLAGAVCVAAVAAAAPGPQLSLVHGPSRPGAGRAAWVVVRAIRVASPASRTKVRIWIARGHMRRSFAARAQSRGRYRAHVVFPTAGRWSFGARSNGTSVRLGSVRVRPVPLTFTWPTSVDVKSNGSVLLVENGSQGVKGRVLRIDPVRGKTVVVARAEKAYAVAHAPSGAVYLSAGKLLLRVTGGGRTTIAAQGDGDIGPVAVAANGDVSYTTETQVFRVAGGSGSPTPVAGPLSGPHGLAVTADGALLVSDTGNRRVVRVDLATRQVETWGDLTVPRGISIASDGTVYVVDASSKRVIHLTADGRRLGRSRHVFGDPYAVAAAGDGSLYVVDTAATGRLYRVAPNGATTVVARR
jgi:sugar lactone lactonase YvrE